MKSAVVAVIAMLLLVHAARAAEPAVEAFVLEDTTRPPAGGNRGSRQGRA